MMAFNLRGNKIESLRVEEHATAEIAAGNITAKSNESRQTAVESLSSFMKDTTLHGARFLFTGNVFRRLFWTPSGSHVIFWILCLSSLSVGRFI